MALGSSTWSFSERDFDAVSAALRRFLEAAACRSCLLVDRSGQLITIVGERPDFDQAAFASLTAADFSANDQLARLLGETEFNSLFHQGERESMYMADVSHRFILVALFGGGTTLGLVRLEMKRAVEELSRLCTGMFSHEGSSERQPGILAGAEDEIDQLFK